MVFRGEYWFLSNFYPSEVEYEGISYPTVEHAYQAAKTPDIKQRASIAVAETPGKARKLGRKLDIYQNWDNMRVLVMRELLRKKFSDKELFRRLKAIEGYIVEENWWGDTFWGVCNGKGENKLGRLLMDIRDGR